jgi:hypothetical protein
MSKKFKRRLLIIVGSMLLALANWPLIVLVNRPEPFVFGLPPFVFAMFLLNLFVALLLFVAYRWDV